MQNNFKLRDEEHPWRDYFFGCMRNNITDIIFGGHLQAEDIGKKCWLKKVHIPANNNE